MLQNKIGRNFLICFLLLNILVVGFFVYAVMKQPELLSNMLPGRFGPAASPDLTGNTYFLALLLLANAALFLTFGLGGTWHALWAGLRISPRKLRWLLHERSGLANDISGVVAEAVQEEEKSELGYLGIARGLLLVGLLLLIAALPAVSIAYAKAAPDGAAMFGTGGAVVANSAVSQDAVLRFTGDQLAGGLLLDVPEIFHLRATPMETNSANILFALFVLLYRALAGFGVLVWFIATRRIGSLRSAAMEVAIAASEIIAMEPVLQDGHGHSEPAHHDHHHHEEHHGHDDHGHSDHGHSDHGHDDHGQDSHGHDDQKHSDHAHDDHGHTDHGHGDHGHDSHGHDDHAHDDHGHGNQHAADATHHDADDESDGDDSESSEDSHSHDAHDHHDSHGHDEHGHAEQSHGHSTHQHAASADNVTHEHKTEETV